MRASIRHFHSADVEDLEAYIPMEWDNFGVSIEMNIGPVGLEGSEIFNFVLYT
jgi:hypothetical protein